MERVESVFSPRQEMPTLFIPTVSLVVMAPLRMPGQPYDYRAFSPTPLDPMLLSIEDEPRYDEAALLYMDEARKRLCTSDEPSFQSPQEAVMWHDAHKDRLPNPVWVSTLREIITQHELKQRRNDMAIRALRRVNTPVTPEEAEEIMQVRAGIASIPTMLRFFARYSQIGGLEIMKATRPGDVAATLGARAALLRELNELQEPDITTQVAEGTRRRLHVMPDPELLDAPDPRVIVCKTRIARAAVRLADTEVPLEIIWRDSGVILDPEQGDDLSDAYILGKNSDGRPEVYVAPISVTAYVRLASSDETAD